VHFDSQNEQTFSVRRKIYDQMARTRICIRMSLATCLSIDRSSDRPISLGRRRCHAWREAQLITTAGKVCKNHVTLSDFPELALPLRPVTHPTASHRPLPPLSQKLDKQLSDLLLRTKLAGLRASSLGRKATIDNEDENELYHIIFHGWEKYITTR
jgi:hypothetical protein